MTLDQWQLLWCVARVATVERVRLDALLYGNGFVDADGWRIDPRDVVIYPIAFDRGRVFATLPRNGR